MVSDLVLEPGPVAVSIEYRGFHQEPFLNPVRKVVAPVPPNVNLEPPTAQSAFLAGRHPLSTLRRLVQSAKPLPRVRQFRSKSRNVRNDPENPKMSRKMLIRDPNSDSPRKGVDEDNRAHLVAFDTNLCALGSVLISPRHPRSENYRAKVHRLRYGLNDTSNPFVDYSTIPDRLSSGAVEVDKGQS